MKLRPLHDRMVIKRLEAEARTAIGILSPTSPRKSPNKGKLSPPGDRDASGKLIPIEVKAGDRVLFATWSGAEVMIDDGDYLIMLESDAMGILIETEAGKKAA